jgi:hypothetical protein
LGGFVNTDDGSNAVGPDVVSFAVVGSIVDGVNEVSTTGVGIADNIIVGLFNHSGTTGDGTSDSMFDGISERKSDGIVDSTAAIVVVGTAVVSNTDAGCVLDKAVVDKYVGLIVEDDSVDVVNEFVVVAVGCTVDGLAVSIVPIVCVVVGSHVEGVIVGDGSVVAIFPDEVVDSESMELLVVVVGGIVEGLIVVDWLIEVVSAMVMAIVDLLVGEIVVWNDVTVKVDDESSIALVGATVSSSDEESEMEGTLVVNVDFGQHCSKKSSLVCAITHASGGINPTSPASKNC